MGTSKSKMNKITILGEHYLEAITGDVAKRELEEKEDDGVLVNPESIYFQDPSTIGVSYQGKTLAGFHVGGRVFLDSEITADKIEVHPKVLHRCLEAESLAWGGSGYNITKALGELDVLRMIEYIALQPKGSAFPDKMEGVEYRIFEMDNSEVPLLLNLVIPRVMNGNGKPIISNKMTIKHPVPRNWDFKEELELNPGVVVLDGITNKGLINSVLEAVDKNNALDKKTIGIAGLSECMRGDIAYALLSGGFTGVMTEREACLHANALLDHLSLKPYADGRMNFADIFLAAAALQRLSGAKAPLYITLGELGSMCVDTSWLLYLGGVIDPIESLEKPEMHDAWTAGLAEMIYLDNPGKKTSIDAKMSYATAFADAKRNGNLSKEYIKENSDFKTIWLKKPVQSYTYRMQIERRANKRINKEIEQIIIENGLGPRN